MQAIEGGDSRDSIMYIDGSVSCDGLVDRGYKHHCRVSRGWNEFVEGGATQATISTTSRAAWVAPRIGWRDTRGYPRRTPVST